MNGPFGIAIDIFMVPPGGLIPGAESRLVSFSQHFSFAGGEWRFGGGGCFCLLPDLDTVL